MKYLSLFSGIGGFDVAFTEAGMECVGMCEIDKNAQEVLRHNFPGVNIYNDVKEIGIGTHTKGSVDLICGGFPCQDLSIAGKRAGLAGERSGLWFEFARIIDELEPGWVVIENVPGLLSSDKGSDFAVIVQWMAERGYGVAWRVLDAQYFGVPQRRRRVFVVGHLGDGRAAEVLFESEGMFGDIAKGGKEGEKEGEKVAGATSPSIVSNGDAHSGFRDEKGLVARPLRAQSQLAHREDIDTLVMAHGQANAEIVMDGSPSLTCHHEQPIVVTSWTLRGGSEGGGKGYLGLEDKAMTLGGQEQMIWEMQHASEAYRESQGGVVPTLQQRMGTGGNQVPMVGVRRLTPTECARLQGFPDSWNDWLSDSARYRQFGNAVAVPVVRWIAERIVGV